MTTFKTKYHALAWAAEDENNVFVDGNKTKLKILGDTLFYFDDNIASWENSWVLVGGAVSFVKEPCHKLEPEKSNEEIALEINKPSTLETLKLLLDECDKRYERRKK